MTIFILCIFFFKIYLWAFYAFTGQCRVDRKALGEERGERDRQRTMSWDSNSGSHERSCAVCRYFDILYSI